jgi:hypothetical protein
MHSWAAAYRLLQLAEYDALLSKDHSIVHADLTWLTAGRSFESCCDSTLAYQMMLSICTMTAMALRVL